MAGRSASNTVTRYAGIQVQTSSLGLNIPVGWGTFRCKCNLVDYLDFKSTAQKAAGGKGGSTTTGYSYSATIILALCEGPIDAVTTVYVDSKAYVHGSASGAANTGSGAAMTQAGLTLNTGAIGQSVWSYLTSGHPTHAIGYSGLAIAYAGHYALDSGATPPNHSFEVVRTASFGVSGSPDADPSRVVTDFFTNGRTGVPSWGAALLGSLAQYQDYCLAAGLLVSPVIDAQRSASDFLTELLMATNSTCVWSEGLLKFIPYGDAVLTGNGKTYTPNNTPVYSLNDDDFVVKAAGDAPVTIDIQDQTDAYNVVQFEYLDRANQYNMAIALANDAANVAQYGMRRKDPDPVHCICTAAVAQHAAQLYLQRTLYIRAQYKFTLHYAFMLLEPGDILELSDAGLGLSAYPVRIIQVDEDEAGQYEITAEDFPIGVSLAPLYAMQTGQGTTLNPAIDPGGVEANLALWSEDFTNAVWSPYDLTVTPNAAADPLFGTVTADKLIPTTANAQHFSYQGIPVFEGVPYSFSLYVRAAGYTQVEIQLSDFVSGNAYANFDLSAGVMTAGPTTAGSEPIALDANISPVGGGWYRIFLTVIPTTATTLFAVVLPYAAGVGTSFPGDGTDGIYAWGAQVKQGVDVPVYCHTGAAIAGPFLFNPPTSLANGPQSQAAAAVAGGANWGGCVVWTSIDGVNYQLQGQIDGPARYGYLMASVAAGTDPDTADTFQLDMGISAGVLTGGSTAAADASASLSLIDGELISYSTVTLTAQDRYSLSGYTRRGVMGTVSAAHAAGSAFIRLDDGVFYFPYIATQAGKQIYVKFQSFNHWGDAVQSLANVNAYLMTLDPVGTGTNAISGGNRICFSDFDKGPNDGWSTGTNASGLTITRASAVYDGIPYNDMACTSTAANQTVSQKSILFPVTGGERLSMTVGLQSFTGWICSGSIGFIDATGAVISHPTVTPTLTSPSFNTMAAGFVQVPTNAVAGWAEFYAESTASGQALNFAVSRPMVCSAAAEQTTYPTYVKGPAAEYGSDITGNWTAAAIYNQSPLATAGIFGSFANLAAAVAAGIADGQTWLNTTNLEVYTFHAPDYFGSFPNLAAAISAGLQNGETWFDTTNSTVYAYLHQADTIVSQGPGATAGVFGSFATLAAAISAGIADGQTWLNTTNNQLYTFHAPDYFGAFSSLANAIAAGLQNGMSWFDTTNGLVYAYVNQADTIVDQAPAATDGTIQTGATYNLTYVQATDPGASMAIPDGAFWYQTSTGVFFHRYDGAWVAVGGQIADGTTIYMANNVTVGSSASWSFTVPGNAPGYVTVVIKGAHGGNTVSYAGGQGGTSTKHFAVTPGTTVISGIIGGAGHSVNDDGSGTVTDGLQTTAAGSSPSVSMTANGGGAATTSANGAAGTASGGDTNTTGGGTIGSVSIIAHTS